MLFRVFVATSSKSSVVAKGLAFNAICFADTYSGSEFNTEEAVLSMSWKIDRISCKTFSAKRQHYNHELIESESFIKQTKHLMYVTQC